MEVVRMRMMNDPKMMKMNHMFRNLVQYQNTVGSGTDVLNNPKAKLDICTNKDFLIKVHSEALAYNLEILSYAKKNGENQRNMKHVITAQSNAGVPTQWPNVELTPENKVDIRTLINFRTMGKSLFGKFLLCRTIAPVNQLAHSTDTVVEDPLGQRAVRIALYNYSSASQEMLQAEFPVGSYLVIKNPLFKPTMDDGFSIRCDNPKDVVKFTQEKLNETFPVVQWKGTIPVEYRHISINAPPAQELKNFGNKCFVEKQFNDAIRFYTQALEISPENTDVLSNRAAAHLNLGCFNKALEDIEAVLNINQYHQKGIYRKVKSLWGLQKYQEAYDFLNSIMTRKSELKTIPDLITLQQSAQRIFKEVTNGELDPTYIRDPKNQNKVLDVAEIASTIEIKLANEDKGRGVFALGRIRPGQLVMSSKAFAYAPEINDPKKGQNLNWNIETRKVKLENQDELRFKIVNTLTIEPEVGKELYKLFAGPELRFLKETDQSNMEIDIERIDKIIQFNAFPVDTNTPSGLWILPSYINHDCVDANCYWEIVGNVLIVRAVKEIKEGEEILIWYKSPYYPMEERQEIFLKRDFVCQCRLCQFEHEMDEETLSRRQKLIKTLYSFMTKEVEDVEENFWDTVRSKISELESFGDDSGELCRIVGFLIMYKVASCLFELKRFEESITLLVSAHTMVKEMCLVRETVMLSNSIMANYFHQHNMESGKKWMRILKHDLKVGYGSLEPFRELGDYSGSLDMLEVLGIEFFS